MDKKVEAYRGSDPYIFVSYAHKNADIVHPFISVLQEKYNVWFDEGIHFGREWDDEIMTRIEQCNLFLFIVTKDSLVSSNCKDELAQARELKKEFISHRPTLEEKISSLGLQQYAEESVNKDIEKLRKDAKKIFQQ